MPGNTVVDFFIDQWEVRVGCGSVNVVNGFQRSIELTNQVFSVYCALVD